MSVTFLFALALRLSLSSAATLAQHATFKAESSSPIAKVVTLITEMKGTAEKEAKADEESYDKYVCWCDTNDKEKAAAIKSGKEHVEELESFVEEAKGTSAKLATEIKGLKSDIEEDEAALDSANEQREKESEEFQAEQADMKETISSIDKAIKALSKMGSFKQTGKRAPKEVEAEAFLQVRTVAKHVANRPQFTNVMQKDLFDVLGSLEQVAKREASKEGSSLASSALLGDVFLPKRDGPSLFQDFLNDAAHPTPPGKKGSAGASGGRTGQIDGILKNMQTHFEKDLGHAQRQDYKALVNFEKLSAAKTSEISSATKQKEIKETQLADLLNKVSESKEGISSTSEAVDADTKFLLNLRKNCKAEKEEYDGRVKVRSDEITALGKTLEILTADDARALFGKTIAFIQTGSSTSAMARLQDRTAKKVMRRLMQVGRKHKDMALLSLAVRVRLDAFTKVKESMSKMMAVLKKQQAEEYDKWEECKKEIDETEDDIKEATDTKKDLAEKHQDLRNTLAELKVNSNNLNTEVADMEVELKKAGEARKTENMLFQTSISDQRATVHILQTAYGKLQAFYAKSSLLQTRQEQPETEEYSKSSNAGGVMQLLAKIIGDAESEGAALAKSESHAQAAYAEFVKDTTDSINAAREALGKDAKQAAEITAENSETDEAKTANDQDIAKFQKLLMGTHQSCDYLLKNFNARQKARSEEMDAISEATAILSGADFK